jgi:hypothetical protein
MICNRLPSWLALSIAFIGCQRGEEGHKRMMSEPVVKGNALFTSSPLASAGLSQRKARKPEHEGLNLLLWAIQPTDNGTLRILYKQTSRFRIQVLGAKLALDKLRAQERPLLRTKGEF